MDDQEDIFNFAKDEYEMNESHDQVIGSTKNRKGFLFFKRNGKPVPVTFVKVDGVDGKDAASRAELIFFTTYGVSDEVVLRPQRPMFIKQKHFAKIPDDIEMRKGVWCICYDRFEPLKHWTEKVQSDEIVQYDDKVKLPIRTPDDCLQDFWRISIRNLIHCVRRIHDKAGLFHGGLHKRSNFVFVNKKLKVINIEGSLAGLSPPEQDERKKKDIMDLRKMLRGRLVSYSNRKFKNFDFS
ncbi:leucine-rich repeat receptor-like protein kinase PXL2 [Prunus yedoensis var. nudiflora]|uniref:Leucine-rich repeat receptor-like protein kinase PXL2 n=1 Tax=Prunus yedoensis var. nudiflora TaxID=2094558 RepID=A0A314UBK9_PRUYE|nr:leucine-rich repeat receptor-like protein kinase PXL2 [Prunus yedoensis var. nudiflora]